jgi:hypothetical protein
MPEPQRLVSTDASRRTLLAGLSGTVAGCTTDQSVDTDPADRASATATNDAQDSGSEPAAVVSVSAETRNGLVEAVRDAEPGTLIRLGPGTHVIDEPVATGKDEIRIVGTGSTHNIPAHCRILTSGDFPTFVLNESEHAHSDRFEWSRGWRLEDVKIGTNTKYHPILDEKKTANLIELHEAHAMRFDNVALLAQQTEGSCIQAVNCFDVHLQDVWLSRPGTAGVHFVRFNNNWHFTNCRWERILTGARAVFSERNEAKHNNTMRFNHCKYHGQPDARPDTLIEGELPHLRMTAPSFAWSNGGFVTVSGDDVQITEARLLKSWNEPTIAIDGDFANVSNCFAQNPGPASQGGDPAPAIEITGDHAVVSGNTLDGHGIVVRDGQRNVVTGNQVVESNDGIATVGESDRNCLGWNVVTGNASIEAAGENNVVANNLDG